MTVEEIRQTMLSNTKRALAEQRKDPFNGIDKVGISHFKHKVGAMTAMDRGMNNWRIISNN